MEGMFSTVQSLNEGGRGGHDRPCSWDTGHFTSSSEDLFVEEECLPCPTTEDGRRGPKTEVDVWTSSLFTEISSFGCEIPTISSAQGHPWGLGEGTGTLPGGRLENTTLWGQTN